MSLNKLILSSFLLFQNFTPYNVGGGELPVETIKQRWVDYNNALKIEREALEQKKLEKEILVAKQEKLRSTTYLISRYIKSIDRKLYWKKYANTISELESSHRYDVINQFGYLGKYQISSKYIHDFGYKGTKEEFLKDKIGQEMVMANYTYNNVRYIKKYNLDKYVGEEINGIKVTIFGLMASAHLVGIKSLTEYLESNGKTIHKDGNDTSIEKYLKAFEMS